MLQIQYSKKRITQAVKATLLFYLVVRYFVIPRPNTDPDPNQWKLPFPVSSKPHVSFNPHRPQRPKNFENVQVIVKTGTAELKSKFPTYVRTVLSAVPRSSLLIFSDAPTTVDSYEILDALDDLSETYKSDHPEFETYEAQKESLASGREFDGHADGWKLDKYKFLPIVSKTWQLRPDKELFFFIELDTFVHWNTMLEFFSSLDASEPLYLGAPVPPVPFAYGGAGFVLSRGAMQKLFQQEVPLADAGTNQFGFNMTDACCGDALLADALKQVGVGIQGYWPMFSGDNPSIIAYGGPEGYWCEPLGTLHHIGPEEMERLWDWTQSRKTLHSIIRYADFFDYALPTISESDGKYWNHETLYAKHVQEMKNIDTPEKCKTSCKENPGCFRYQFQDQLCELSFSMQVGKSLPEHEIHVTYRAEASIARIEAFRASSFCIDPPFKPWFRTNKPWYRKVTCFMSQNCE